MNKGSLRPCNHPTCSKKCVNFVADDIPHFSHFCKICGCEVTYHVESAQEKNKKGASEDEHLNAEHVVANGRAIQAPIMIGLEQEEDFDANERGFIGPVQAPIMIDLEQEEDFDANEGGFIGPAFFTDLTQVPVFYNGPAFFMDLSQDDEEE